MKAKVVILAAAVVMVVSATAYAATAYWTGKMRFVTTVTYQQGVNCEYNYAGQKFWRTFAGSSCPSSVEVQ